MKRLLLGLFLLSVLLIVGCDSNWLRQENQRNPELEQLLPFEKKLLCQPVYVYRPEANVSWDHEGLISKQELFGLFRSSQCYVDHLANSNETIHFDINYNYDVDIITLSKNDSSTTAEIIEHHGDYDCSSNFTTGYGVVDRIGFSIAYLRAALVDEEGYLLGFECKVIIDAESGEIVGQEWFENDW